MSSSASSGNNSSAMCPTGTFKKFTAKLDAKLKKVKGKMHKAKSSNKNNEFEMTSSTSTFKKLTSKLEGKLHKAKASNKPNAVSTKADEANNKFNEVTIINTDEVNNMPTEVTIETEETKNKPTEVATIKTDEASTKTDDAMIAPTEIKTIGTEEANKKLNKVITTPTEVAVKPGHTTDKGGDISTNPNHPGDEAQEPNNPASFQKPNEEGKAAKREAKKEARKAKWATRRAAFKTKAKKIGEALFLPTALVLGIVCAPAILVFNLVLCVVNSVFWLVAKILDLLCVPFMLCWLWRR